MRSGQITELTLGGFQVFSDRVAIPMGPITLLFGPNSAGKSAIADGLQVLARFCGLFNPSGKLSNLGAGEFAASLLERHWRVEPGQVPTLAPAVDLAVRVRVERSIWATAVIATRHHGNVFTADQPRFEDAVEALEPWLRVGGHDELELSLHFEVGGELAIDPERRQKIRGEIHWEAQVGLAGVPLLRFEKFSAAAVHLAHPALGKRYWLKSFQHLAKAFPNDFRLDDGWVSLQLGADVWSTGFDEGTMAGVLEGMDAPFDRESEVACGDFAALFDAIWMSTVATVGSIVDVGTVPASRAIPTRHELTFLKDAEGSDVSPAKLGLNIEGRKDFNQLAVGALRACRGLVDSVDDFPPAAYRLHIDRVNRLLAEHLFKESGYFVVGEVHALTPVDSGQALSVDSEEHPGRTELRYLVTLVLGDASGRHFNFDEVGSGLGYVLPVLVALSDPRLTFIQQPELHLHPALQAEVADALISALDDGKGADAQVIVETHSEHLLLRLLRRIRQSSGVDSSTHPYALAPSDLVVLYVNPTLAGASTVKRLRVDSAGEFLARMFHRK